MFRRLLNLFRPNRLDAEIREELAYHRGRTRGTFGNFTAIQERTRDASTIVWLETLVQDVRYGSRQLLRNAGATVVTVLALALGIGTGTAVFTGYKAFVARPLDARNPGEMVNLALQRDSGAGEYTFSYPDYQAYRDSLRSCSGLVAFRPARMTLSNAGGIVSQRASASESVLGRLALLPSGAANAEFATVFAVSENYFRVLGVSAIQGRTFESIPTAEFASAPPVLVSENYWRRRFAADPAILGKTVYLNGAAVTVAGVAPRDFAGTSVGAPAFWLPACVEPLMRGDTQWLRDRENRQYRLFGRLAPGAGIGQAEAEMSRLADRLRALHDPRSESARPAKALVWPGSPFPLPLNRYGGLRLAILLAMAAAGMVLAVACANAGGLQLARARSRENELRTRMALGAGRLRVIRQLLTESVLVGLLAGVLALLFSWTFLKVAVSLFANALPAEYGAPVFDVAPDPAVFAFVAAVSLIAGMLSGMAPAMESSRTALSPAFRTVTSPFRSRRLQDVLVASQVALSLTLMVAGSMAVRSAVKSLAADTGYESKRVFALGFQFPETAKYNAARKLALTHELRTRLAALPGVAGVTSARPPGQNSFRTTAAPLRGETPPEQSAQSLVYYGYVQADYFQTLGIPLVLGRGFPPQASQPERSAVISESAARQLCPGPNPVGCGLRLGPTDERVHNRSELSVTGPVYQVIGVVRDTRGAEFDASGKKRVYLPLPAGSRAYSHCVSPLVSPRDLVDSQYKTCRTAWPQPCTPPAGSGTPACRRRHVLQAGSPGRT